jgi:predicted DNA-binding ribbon-helix-helix protein
MKSLVTKRSIVVAGHKTSVSLEEAFWKGLKEIASIRKVALSELIGSIDTERLHRNLSSAIRLFVLDYYRTKIGAASGAAGTDVERTHVPPPESSTKI